MKRYKTSLLSSSPIPCNSLKALTWKERQARERKAARDKKLQDICFIVEGILIISILWLVVPQIVEGIM